MTAKGQKCPLIEKSSVYSENDLHSPSYVSLSLILKGDGFGPGEWNFLTLFNGQVIHETKWHKNVTLQSELSVDLNRSYSQSILADKPLIFLVRIVGLKGTKDPDPLVCADNHAGATFDLFPLVLGEKELFTKVRLVNINTGLSTVCAVEVSAKIEGGVERDKIPLILTMISGHCFPTTKEGTVYLSAIALNDIQSPQAAKFGMSLSNSNAKKVVWASACNGGLAANTAFNVPSEDKFVADDFELMETDACTSVYWNSMTRVLVDSTNLRERLKAPFLIEIAGVPKVGKIDVRGRYMAFVDAGVLLEPGQFGVTTCARLLFYSESNLPEGTGALLELPPASAKPVSARESNFVSDDSGNAAYIVIRFDLFDSLSAKAKMSSLFEVLGFPPPDGFAAPTNELYVESVPDDTPLDVRRIRKEAGALAVHKELSGLSCRGKVQMNQSIKRTAANRLLTRTRALVKQFPPGECSFLEWQDTVTAQHAAVRGAVTSSFAPQPPPPRSTSRIAAVRNRLAGDIRIAEEHIENNLAAVPHHPRVLLSKCLRCLEIKNDSEARTYLLRALSAQTRNRYLLWTFGGSEFYKEESYEIASAAFRVAVKGDTSDGTTGAVGWAALHALHHYNQNSYAAFVAARKMRKAYEVSKEWKKFLQRWVETSGEEETFWIPAIIDIKNPMLVAAAFFLCLRCYKFSERLIQCVEDGCVVRGSRYDLKNEPTVDMFYIRAASLILQRELEKALELIEQGIKQYGPSAQMSQIRAVCLTCLRGWDGSCDTALLEADRAGAQTLPLLLQRGALGLLKSDPRVALQRAARAHKVAPSPHSALVISRIYAKTGKEKLAERWAAAAVETEPLLADGWAVLAILAMTNRNIDKARAMLRTAQQAGPISAEIKEELRRVIKVVPIETLPDALVKDLCLCEYY
ncbi:uncharacterized protein LOC120624315 [Pararge aegeria]|uniref:Jg5634 protein n=1 Tax=Pararge aegeria aegeria TaxID=348720 RepID=A0A8S4QT22_9NEOP|nr:uncharacterized protein LOC120624315 [Pararge aegeria]CAH2217324.1 jg5634 [Pararge aegeria aegeria]